MRYSLLIGLGLAAAWLCCVLRVPAWLVSTAVVGATALVLAVSERLAPGREDCAGLDQPLRFEIAHLFCGWLVGYGTAVWLCDVAGCWTRSFLGAELWPVSWPLGWQVALACFTAEGTSYWQHRLFHRHPALWRFHKLHHQGPRLNFVRSSRFHFVDISVAAVFEYLPLILLGAPPIVLAWLSAITGAMGIIQHANVRMVTPPWVTLFLVTPAIHRTHHSSDGRESDANFGTVTTLFDVLFGTYLRPRSEWPDAVGVEGDGLAPTIGRQLWPPQDRRNYLNMESQPFQLVEEPLEPDVVRVTSPR